MSIREPAASRALPLTRATRIIPGAWSGSMRALARAGLCVFTIACSRDAATHSRMQPVVDAYAPGLELGAPVTEAARRRYGLVVAPYVGYAADTNYRGSAGTRQLMVLMDEYVDDSNRRVFAGARVVGMSLKVPATESVRAVEAQLRGWFGTPEELCYTSHVGAEVLRARYWPADRRQGVLLVGSTDAAADTAMLTVGAEPIDTTHVEIRQCPEPKQ